MSAILDLSHGATTSADATTDSTAPAIDRAWVGPTLAASLGVLAAAATTWWLVAVSAVSMGVGGPGF